METIKHATGIDLMQIPYKGGGQAIGDVVSGQVKVGVLGMAPALPHIKSGKLVALAVTGGQRVAAVARRADSGGGGRAGLRDRAMAGNVGARRHAARDHPAHARRAGAHHELAAW